MTRYATAVIAFWTLLLLATASPLSKQPLAQEVHSTPDWGDYPLLMSQFGELCTMCEAYLKCEADGLSNPDSEAFTLYYFQTKTFWGQIATIWDYFAKWFDPVTSENRPATIYRFQKNSRISEPVPTKTNLSVADSRIDIDNTWIDRDGSTWHNRSGDVIGTCKRLSIPESMAMIIERERLIGREQRDANP
jgi:hypothetical protein